MKKLASVLALVAVTASFQAFAGDVTGKITLKGTPPAEKTLDALKNDPNCGKMHTEVPKTKFYVVGAGGELADVVVSIKGISGKSTGASAAPVVLDQKGCEYVPYVAAVQTGQKIHAKNSDPVMHNVHTTPTVEGNKEINKAQMAKGADIEFVFDKAESFLRFKCDVHPWMFSYVSVFDHPYFAVSAADGSFKIAGVPDGKYTLEAVHRKGGTVTKEIEVKGGAVTADLVFEVK